MGLDLRQHRTGIQRHMFLHLPNSEGFCVRHVRLTAPAFASDAPPLRFAHLSDLHMQRFTARHARLVQEINGRDVDFVFLTGDILSSAPGTRSATARLLRSLQCRRGVYACRGNWEVKCAGRPSRLAGWMSQHGARLLINESESAPTPAGTVLVSALDDLSAGAPDLESTLQSSPSGAAYRILLSHAPLAAQLLPECAGIHLVLSGHTHGGQIRIPWLWKHVLPRCHGSFTGGLYTFRWGHLYVSRGFGTVRVPLRLFCPPEVTFFEVTGSGND